jgi:hypothetical protein
LPELRVFYQAKAGFPEERKEKKETYIRDEEWE